MNYFILDNKNYYDNIWDYYMSQNNIYDKLTIQLMEQYNAFNQQMKTVEDEYVLRGAILQCTHGNRYTYLDICKDYGIYYSSEAVMTCQDDKINENVYNFALCGNKHYEPTYSKDVMPNEDKGKDLNGCIRNKCFPILVKGWEDKNNIQSNSLYISTKKTDLSKSDNGFDCKYSRVLMAKDTLLCLYGGLINIVENGNSNLEVKTGTESAMLVTLEQLDNFGFYMGKNDSERDLGVKELNRVLSKYEINTDVRVAFFLGQVAKESKFGTRTLETFNGDDPNK